MICSRWRVVAELDARPLHLAAPLDVDALRAVDQDVADRMVFEQQFERAQTEGLVQHLFDQPLALVAVEKRLFRVAQVFDDQANLAAQHVAFQFADLRQVQFVDELAVDAALELVEFLGLAPRRPNAWLVRAWHRCIVPSVVSELAAGFGERPSVAAARDP